MNVMKLQHALAFPPTMPRCRIMVRRLVPAVLLVALVAPLVCAVPVSADDAADRRAAAKAARQIAEAQRQADLAAKQFADAETAVAEAEANLASLQAQEDAVAQKVDALRGSIQQLALLRYVQGGTETGGLLLGSGPGTQLQASEYAELAAKADAQDVDAYEATIEDLGRMKAAVEQARKKSQKAAKNLSALRKKLERRIVRLKKAEEKRKKDVTVRKALEALRAQQARAARAAALKAAAALAARNPGRSVVGGPYDGNLAGYGHDYGGAGFYCPVAGPNTFTDTWGASRGGSRRHQGVDLLAARGTPEVAVVSGFVRASHNRLGGNALWLDGVDGNSYYYAHLDHYGKFGAVSAGDVIGYVGDTGNARGTPHLHFEVHPGHGAAVNPYPTARSHC
jgi:murein DD-endopeptidase MepM/ murein hydrolase activator NlpD